MSRAEPRGVTSSEHEGLVCLEYRSSKLWLTLESHLRQAEFDACFSSCTCSACTRLQSVHSDVLAYRSNRLQWAGTHPQELHFNLSNACDQWWAPELYSLHSSSYMLKGMLTTELIDCTWHALTVLEC